MVLAEEKVGGYLNIILVLLFHFQHCIRYVPQLVQLALKKTDDSSSNCAVTGAMEMSVGAFETHTALTGTERQYYDPPFFFHFTHFMKIPQAARFEYNQPWSKAEPI